MENALDMNAKRNMSRGAEYWIAVSVMECKEHPWTSAVLMVKKTAENDRKYPKTITALFPRLLVRCEKDAKKTRGCLE